MSYAARHMNPSRHLIGVAIVIAVHVLTAYALMTGLARKVVEVVRGPDPGGAAGAWGGL